MRVIRSELKYYISNFTYHILRNRLKYILKRDRHNLKDGGYFIRSLYFDSYSDDALYEKQSGFINRKKYRVRIYNTNSDFAKFEIKYRYNSQVFKESYVITRDSVEKLNSR